jgi:hypothetical protein
MSNSLQTASLLSVRFILPNLIDADSHLRIGLYLNPLSRVNAPPIESSIHQVTKEASLLYCLPDNPFFRNPDAVTPITHAVQEATYACK